MSRVAARWIAIGLGLAALALLAACRAQPAAPAPGAVREARRLQFDPAGGGRLLVVERGGDVTLWRLAADGRATGLQRLAAGATDAQFLPGGGVASGGADGRVRQWTAGGTPGWTSAGGHAGPVRSLAVGPQRIASAGADGAIRLWTLAGDAAGTLAGHAGAVLAVAFSPDGVWLASEGADTRLRLWRRQADGGYAPAAEFRDANAGYAALLPNLLRHDVAWGWDRSLAFTAGGDALLAADLGGQLQRWGTDGRRRGAPLRPPRRQHMRAVAVAADGTIAAAVHDGTVQLWRADGQPLATLRGHRGQTLAVAWSADGTLLASAGLDGVVRLWRPDGRPLGRLPAAGK